MNIGEFSFSDTYKGSMMEIYVGYEMCLEWENIYHKLPLEDVLAVQIEITDSLSQYIWCVASKDCVCVQCFDSSPSFPDVSFPYQQSL